MRLMKILCLLLLPIIACSQVQKFEKVKTDTLQSKTDTAYVYIQDSARVAFYVRFDSTGSYSLASVGSGKLVARGNAGLYWLDFNSSWRLDTSYSGVYVPTGDSITGIFYVTLKRLQDSNTVLRTDLKRKNDSTASDGYLPVHRLSDSTSSLRTDLARKSITISTNAPLNGGGDLSANRTLSVDTSTVGTGLTTLYQNSLKLAKTDTLSLSNRIDAKNRKQTWKEVDGSPSVTDVDTVEVDSNFAITNVSNQRVRLRTSQPLTTLSNPGFAGLSINPGTANFAAVSITGNITPEVAGSNATMTVDASGLVSSIAQVAKGRMPYSQGTTSPWIWEDYPFLYSSTSNLGFGLTDTSVNKNISSIAQSGDTSSIRFDFTNLGKPRMFVKGTTGNSIFTIDSQYVGIGTGTTDSMLNVTGSTHLTSNVRIDGTTVLGTSAPNVRLGQLLDADVSSTWGGLSLTTWSTSAGHAPILDMKHSKSATIGTHTVVASGDILGHLVFRGSDGTQFIDAAYIKGEVDGTPGTNDMPGRIVFLVTADGAASSSEAMRISNDKSLTFTAAVRGSDSYTTTATTDTVTVTGGATTDYYFIQPTGTAAPAAADFMTVEALTGKFVVHRSASGTSGLTYNWFRIK